MESKGLIPTVPEAKAAAPEASAFSIGVPFSVPHSTVSRTVAYNAEFVTQCVAWRRYSSSLGLELVEMNVRSERETKRKRGKPCERKRKGRVKEEEEETESEDGTVR
ncbi:hypothetical protein VNO78_33490 [Psophocarpus tetragonolobus]|uniref:Uncharacterized protein n=1 Tax=Psophocarpus tetragonolobus TaxID=3891 RepID=A0AAN9NX21_PSOTE